ncbi:MAG: hypothetical protein LBT50_04985 [Prevotellaceae bacterium]|jgi:hypothetical protein|nr:hypothetical protein [Prevotellaceae bacterium]
MTTKKFPCKIEELPTIGEFILECVRKDFADFSSYSFLFTPEYPEIIQKKIVTCKELVASSTVAKELKAVTQQLYDKSKQLRIQMNVLEGYLKIGAKEMDILLEDVGLKSVRHNITHKNTEGLILNVQKALTAVKRNLPALTATGLKPELIGDIEKQMQTIDALNVKQNNLISERSRLTKANIELFNDLWDSLRPILATAKALYRGVDEVKLKDYTMLQLKKRINAERKK